jgi:phosphohistidine swiveling domain-containing protein
MLSDKKIINGIVWKRINMRSVGHLLGVEFMHDLYNRHAPRINFIRFRNTVTTWKDGIVNSYAPEKEFDQIERWFGEKFYSLDKTTIREFSILLDSDRVFFNEQMARFERIDLCSLSNINIGLLLIDIQQYSLGELYKMNFVQAEYSLTSAIKRILKEINPNESVVNDAISRIITTDIPTESQEEEMAFYKIASLKKDKLSPINNSFSKLLKKHFDNFTYMHSAYGEKPYDYNYYENKFINFDPSVKSLTPKENKKQILILNKKGKKYLANFKNKKLNILVPLMIKGGTFRDRNKASLGYTIKYKHKIFEEISNRKLETRENLNFYLLSEILKLLDENVKVLQEVINERKNSGVVLIRSEYMDIAENFEAMELFLPDTNKLTTHNSTILKGRCASSGYAKGIAKVVYTKADSVKVNKGDIMVAIGTDFDLMDAIHRSAGIITEEGGLLSHASVVSREMKKPCVIGVEGATGTIKDGDKIILDSEKGTITIINR